MSKLLPLEGRLLNKNWEVRNAANVELTALFDSITDPKDPRIRELGHVFRETVADSHSQVQYKALDALIAYLKAADADAIRYAKEVCNAVVANCLTGWPKTVEKAQLVFMLWVELGAVDVFMDAMEIAVKHKVAKAVVPAIDVMFQALSEFGSKIVPPKRILKMLPELLDHHDKDIRASSKKLTLELSRWIGGDDVKSMLFKKMKDIMKNELEAELANVTGSAKPTRKIRSEQDKEKETQQEVQTEAGPSEESAAAELATGSAKPTRKIRCEQDKETEEEVQTEAGPSEESAETAQEIDEYELLEAVDILKPLEKSGFWNGVIATKWAERRKAVRELTKLASTKRIAPGDFLQICHTLKKLIMDKSTPVGVEAVNAIGKLALGLRTDFSASSRFILPVLLEKLKEKKPSMTEALTNTLQAIYKAGCVTLVDIVEDIKVAVKSKVPLVRSLTLNWVTHCIERSNKAVILKVHKDYVLICVECLNDGTPDVMDAATSVLAAIAKLVGTRPLEKFLDDVTLKKLLDMIGCSRSGAPNVKEPLIQLSHTSSLGGAAEVRQENDDTPLILTHNSAKFKLPGGIKNGLYEHQIKGIKWLWGRHLAGEGGIVGDDMGLGKTRMVSAFLAGLYNSKLTNKVLLVCPKTLLPQWSHEFFKMGLPQSNIYHGADKVKQLDDFKQKDKGVLLTTYKMVTLDGDTLCSLAFDYVILDEGHEIKNWKSKVCQNIKKTPSLHRILVTGTPMQNNLEELWTLFSFCVPSLFGDLGKFKKDFETPMVKGIETFASVSERQKGIATKEKLDKLVNRYLLRRTKEEVFTNGEIPNKTELVVWLQPNKCQRELYTSIQESEIFRVACHSCPLAVLTILRKLCSHPYLTQRLEGDEEESSSKNNEGDEEESTSKNKEETSGTNANILALKMDELTRAYPGRLTSCKISLIKSLVVDLVKQKHHILIFCQWQKMIDLIKVSLETEGLECLRMDGKSKEREQTIQKFQSGEAKVFLLTSAVGGVGLTLTKADRVILADPAWNPSIDNQSVDRAYRLGQTRDVVVYRILTCGTVEETIYKTQAYKSSLIGTVMESRLSCSHFTTSEKKDCFKKTNFKFSSSIRELLKKQHRDSKESILQEHTQYLNSLAKIAGILNHHSVFRKATPQKPPPKSDMVRETSRNRSNWYDEWIKETEQNRDNEEKVIAGTPNHNDGSGGRPSLGEETRPGSSSFPKTQNDCPRGNFLTPHMPRPVRQDIYPRRVSPNHSSSGRPSLGGSSSLPKTRNDHGSDGPPTSPRGNFLRPYMRQDIYPRRVPASPPMSYYQPGMRPEMRQGRPRPP